MSAALPLESAAAPHSPVRTARRRLRRRSTLTCMVLAGLLAAGFVLALVLGDFPLSVSDVVASLTGHGTRASDFIVHQLRLPRALAALAVGAAFGLSGAIFQTLLRNPLASPDIIGISSGASAAAVVAILVLGLRGASVAGFAFCGALLTALAIYLLSYRNGVLGSRLVLVGIGLAAVLYAVIDFLMTRAEIYQAAAALVWLTGSLNGADMESLRPLLVLLAVVTPLLLWAHRSLGGLQLGDDTAKGLGVKVEHTRLLLILMGVALAAVATSAAGPVGFVAFVAPPIARRITHDPGPNLVAAALVGAAVVASADLVGQHLLPVELPVGVLTSAVGAPYLIYLLTRTAARLGEG